MRKILILFLLCCTVSAYAITISDGSTNYSLSTQALSEMTEEVILAMGYVVGVLYAIGSLTAIYNAMVIYIKVNNGEDGFTKSVVMLIGAVMFLIGATIFLPALFGYNTGASGYSPFG